MAKLNCKTSKVYVIPIVKFVWKNTIPRLVYDILFILTIILEKYLMSCKCRLMTGFVTIDERCVRSSYININKKLF